MSTAKRKPKPESFIDYYDNRPHLRDWKRAASGVSVDAGIFRIRMEATGTLQQRKEVAAMIEQAPEFFLSMQSFFANWPQFDPDRPECHDDEVNGGDLVDWFNDQAPYWHEQLKKARVSEEPYGDEEKLLSWKRELRGTKSCARRVRKLLRELKTGQPEELKLTKAQCDYVARAIEAYHDEGTLEVHGHDSSALPSHVVSEGEGGAYVLAWVWVPKEAA